MDIKGMLSSEPSDGQKKPDLQPRLSINNLVNHSSQPTPSPVPLTAQQAAAAQNRRPSPLPTSSSSSVSDIRQRNSIINITNDDDVDIRGNVTPSVARRYSSSEQSSPMLVMSAVKKRSIQEELELFNKLEAQKISEAKPLKHKKPPVWSLDWIPLMKKKGGVGSGHGALGNGHGNGHGNGSASRYERTAPSSRLEAPSITGVEPSHDLEYAVASWIYAILSEVPEQERQYLEIELKFGRIFSKEHDERLQLPINTETVLNLEFFHKNCFFKPGLPAESFQNGLKFMDVTNKKTKHKFSVEKANHRDNFCQKHDRGNKPLDARITYDIETNRRVEAITKKRVSDLFIYSPATHFDLRCSISLELPIQITEEEEKKLTKNITLIREKLRTSFFHPSTFTRLDFTSTKQFDKHHGSQRNRPPEENYELELELNCNELWASFLNLKTDSQYYYDLIKTFLSNGRVLNKELS